MRWPSVEEITTEDLTPTVKALFELLFPGQLSNVGAPAGETPRPYEPLNQL